MQVYKTTNLINGKVYIGQDSHNNPNYFGSGLLINKALKKYGKQNFKKETLQFCITKKELDIAETTWINKSNCFPPYGYN